MDFEGLLSNLHRKANDVQISKDTRDNQLKEILNELSNCIKKGIAV